MYKSLISKIIERVRAKYLEVTLLFVYFGKAFDSIQITKMEKVQPADDLPKETVTIIMMLNKNTKVFVRSLDRDPDFVDLITGFLQGNTLVPYLFIIGLDNVIRTLIDLKKDLIK